MIKHPLRIARPAPLSALSATALSATLFAAMTMTPATAAPLPAGSPPTGSAANNSTIIKLPMQPVVGAELRTCATRTASALGTTVLREGTGPKPGSTDFVLVGYIGYLASTGQVFDQNGRTPLNLGNVIPGFAEGLQLMTRGSVWRLCVPAAQGYGAKGAGDAVPANADLVFQIELIDFKSMAEVETMRKAQEAGQAAPAVPVQPVPAPSVPRPKPAPTGH